MVIIFFLLFTGWRGNLAPRLFYLNLFAIVCQLAACVHFCRGPDAQDLTQRVLLAFILSVPGSSI
jgi:hypothetical protein